MAWTILFVQSLSFVTNRRAFFILEDFMSNNELPIDYNQLPEDAKLYFRLIEENKNHPIIRNFFQEIKQLSLQGENGQFVKFFVIEMRIDNNSFLVWQDSENNWGVGQPISLPEDDSDLADSEEPLSIDYFQNSFAHETFEQVLDFFNYLLDLAEQNDPERKVIRFSRN